MWISTWLVCINALCTRWHCVVTSWTVSQSEWIFCCFLSLRRKSQQAHRSTLASSALSSEDEDGFYDSKISSEWESWTRATHTPPTAKWQWLLAWQDHKTFLLLSINTFSCMRFHLCQNYVSLVSFQLWALNLLCGWAFQYCAERLSENFM